MSWCTIESDPGVFTELIEAYGSKGLQLEELFSLDEESVVSCAPYGLVFLFKWTRDAARSTSGAETDDAAASAGSDTDAADAGVYFCKQIVNNACATIALLHMLLNAEGIDIGPTLTSFKEFTMDMPPDLRGQVLGQWDDIRIAHNSFARPEAFEAAPERVATDDDDVYHFIAYTSVGGRVYELDGLRDAPRCLGKVKEGEHWAMCATPAIQQRIASYAASEIRFNLLALVPNPGDAAARRAAAALASLEALYTRLVASEFAAALRAPAVIRAALPALEELPAAAEEDEAVAAEAAATAADAAACVPLYAQAEAALTDAAYALASEKEKRANWKAENERRRHNFVPLIMELMRQLAARGQLEPMLAAGKEKAAAARASAKKRRTGGDDE